MKPRLFVGSSRESISIAYAAQQNLQHKAEVTVWDQGVFQLSVSALESLLPALGTCDFAMFVFSPDDVLEIRGEENAAVRDNVIFELGLFVGVLGRERCFMLVPEDAQDLRIPTDLIGMTPATFETGRSDGSMQAATGPACHAIQQTIDRLGMRTGRAALAKFGAPSSESTKEESEADASPAARERETGKKPWIPPDWLRAMADEDYSRAAELLEQSLKNGDAEYGKDYLDSCLGRAKYHLDPREGAAHLETVIARYPSSVYPYMQFAYAHRTRGLFSEALAIVERGLLAVGDDVSLIRAKVNCLSSMGEGARATDVLRQAISENRSLDLYLALAAHYSDQNDLEGERAVLEDADQEFPRSKAVLDRYARLLSTLPDKKLALVPYEKLIRLEPENPHYLAMRANVLLDLELNDLAMRGYRKANEHAQSQQAWILENIGNLLKNRGFYADGIEYLKRGLDLAPESQYGHERLAQAIKVRDEEDKRLSELLEEARRELDAAKLRRIREVKGEPTPEGSA